MREVLRVKKNIFLIILGFGALCIIYYLLFPKYRFQNMGNGFFRYNRITGSVSITGGDRFDGQWHRVAPTKK